MRIQLTVTNDLTYDQRMQRIATALVEAGHEVTLVGRVLPSSKPLENQAFAQKRLRCWFNKGFAFYAEYNLRLFFYLLFAGFDAVGTVDLDTLPAGALASWLRRKGRVFDAHEYFEEVPEVQGRRFVQAFWRGVARVFLPFYHHAYTVGPALADLFSRKYGIPFTVVRNVPVRREGVVPPAHDRQPRILLYQGALNAGRGIEAALNAMTRLDGVQLWLAGEGDLSDDLRRLARELGLKENKVRFLGFVKPSELKTITDQAWLGLNLLENKGLSYYYSLANKFFDYVQARVPVLTMDFPEYRALNNCFEVARLLNEATPDAIVEAVEQLLLEPDLYHRLQENETRAAEEWVWEKDKQVLLSVWATVGVKFPWRAESG